MGFRNVLVEQLKPGILQDKGTISVPGEFPFPTSLRYGDVYRILVDVTDNDPTRTNTGLSFASGEEIYWTGTTWRSLGLAQQADYVRTIRYQVDLATADSNALLPAGCRVIEARCEIFIAYSPGATLSVGVVGTPAAFMSSADIKENKVDTYVVPQDTLVSATSVVRTTVAGAPAVGQAFITVVYNTPRT